MLVFGCSCVCKSCMRNCDVGVCLWVFVCVQVLYV